MKKFSLILFLIALVLVVTHVTYVYASSACSKLDDATLKKMSEDELSSYVDKCGAEVDKLQNTANTLASQLQNLDSQINLTQARIQNSIAKISQTTKDIQKLGDSLVDLGIRIDKLQDSINYQNKVFAARMRTRYKINETSPLIVLFGSETINQIVQKAEYLQVMGLQDKKLLTEMDQTKTAFYKQKDLFETKKKESEELKAKLEREKADLDAYKNDLANQKEDKENLLVSTQADEQKYQALLQKAENELAGFKSFVQSSGDGTIDANGFGSGKEGWYLSQRDARWANTKIGKSHDTIFEVGCLVTSVAMIYRHYGVSITPDSIAKDSSRFFYPTADMLIPWKGPGGRTYHSIYVSQIDAELKNNPVIVGIYAGSFGTHFVVLSKKSGSDWIMYDPFYGPDLKFTSRYKVSSIFQAVVFK